MFNFISRWQRRRTLSTSSDTMSSEDKHGDDFLVPYAFQTFKLEQLRPLNNSRDMVPQARSGHRIAFDDTNKVYCWGGYNPDKRPGEPLFYEFWKFNSDTCQWRLLANKGETPPFIVSHSMHYLNKNTILVFGGTSFPFGVRSSNKLFLCDLRSYTWRLLKPLSGSSDETPHELYGQGCCWDPEEGVFYTVGGTNGYFYACDVHKFNLKQRCWQKLSVSSIPRGRYRHSVIKHDNKLYLFGGGGSGHHYNLRRIDVFDLKELKWFKLEATVSKDFDQFKSRRNFQCAVKYSHYVYVIGGIEYESSCRDIVRYDLIKNVWTFVASLPHTLYFHSASISQNGFLVIFGGVITYDPNGAHAMPQHRSNTVFTMWVDVPTLSEIAWQSILHYVGAKRLLSMTEKNLLKMGISTEFIKRLRA